MGTPARSAVLAVVVLAGCLSAPPGGGGGDAQPVVDAAPPPATCETVEQCPVQSADVSCHCGECAILDARCDASGLQYLSEDGSSAGCVPGPEQLALGYQLSCLRWSNGEVSCWGTNCQGQLGDGGEHSCPDDLSSPLPSLVRVEAGGAPLDDVVSLTVGLRHVCALRGDHTVWCWGDNVSGKVGGGSAETILSSPIQVIRELDSTPLAGVVALAAGGSHTCAVDGEGAAWCWGDNDYRQLGLEQMGDRAAAVQLPGSAGWTGVSGGGLHTCATRPETAGGPKPLWCWGRNTYGELGHGTMGEPGDPTPSLVGYEGDLASPVVPNAVGLGIDFSCAAVVGPSALCWGRNIAHALGDEGVPSGADGVDASGARLVALAAPSGIEQIAAGGDFACARMGDGSLQCWGGNAFGQLGLGSTSEPAPPTPVDLDVTDVGAGTDHACAITYDRQVECWGHNDRGQLGDGTVSVDPQPTPTLVSDLCP